jgi:WD40 repeat protein
MNPRYRRLLIPGLLLALLAIVVIASLAGKADAATAEPEAVSTLSDGRINESSGLATSADDDRVFTINDSGGTPVVYAIQVSTGSTVGTARVEAELVDTEAISRDAEGTLWIADTGDNQAVRTDAALYSVPEFGPGDAVATSVRRYPVVYPGGPIDVEALVVSPLTGEKFLISKGLLGGTVFSLPDPLVPDRPNEAVALEGEIPGLVTDASFTPDGRYVVARDYSEAYVLDAKTWEIVSTMDLPSVDQGESLAVETAGRTLLVGSEGSDSPLIRVPLSTPDDTKAAPAEATTAPPGLASAPPAGGNGFAGATWFWAAVVVALLAAISAGAVRRR